MSSRASRFRRSRAVTTTGCAVLHGSFVGPNGSITDLTSSLNRYGFVVESSAAAAAVSSLVDFHSSIDL